MKKVAGPLKLELAQFRALEAFAKFGSDLDKSTQQQLRRGARLMEIMKQSQYTPVPVEDQVIVIFAATNGYMDELPVEEVRRYERELLDLAHSAHSELVTALANEKALTDPIVEKLKAMIGGFTERFISALR